jgi:hypothetical protein
MALKRNWICPGTAAVPQRKNFDLERIFNGPAKDIQKRGAKAI